MYDRLVNWFNATSRRTKIVLAVAAFLTLPFLLFSSRIITVLMLGFFLLSVVMLGVRSYRGEPSRNWAIAAGSSLLVLFGFLALVGVVYSGPSGERAATEAASDKENAKSNAAPDKGKSKYGKADFNGPGDPSKQPIEVVLKVAGSEGGVYEGWVYRDETNIDERLFNTDKPDFRGVLGPEPEEYQFSLGDGIYKDSAGEEEWDKLTVDIEKGERRGRDWEGEVYAALLVDGRRVSCSSTQSSSALTVSYSPEYKKGEWIEKLNCNG